MESSPHEFQEGSFLTLEEAAKRAGIQIHTLRFWESRFSQLHSKKWSGQQRLFREEDLELINEIRELLYEKNYTIREAQLFLNRNRMEQSLLISGMETEAVSEKAVSPSGEGDSDFDLTPTSPLEESRPLGERPERHSPFSPEKKEEEEIDAPLEARRQKTRFMLNQLRADLLDMRLRLREEVERIKQIR